jgi:formamidopyrimidine-DNA glycosylase
MPELPDVEVYVDALRRLVVGQQLVHVRLKNPFLLRTVDPPLDAFGGRGLLDASRLAKRIVLAFDDDFFLVIHLMIAGRLHWVTGERRRGQARGLADFVFEGGILVLTEAGTKRWASLHAVRGRQALQDHMPAGIDAVAATFEEFVRALRRENHTLKRALTDQRLISGIGNAYSDELLHRARLSPLKLTSRLDDEELSRLYDATRATLMDWTDRLREETRSGFPEKVTAFRAGMAVHGRFGQPCPACSTPVQRIVYAENECNYCPRCQTGGRLLADRALSRLLREDWPRTLSE